nr:alkaline phosphatase family protein [Chloroflexota bacterium]
MDTDTTTSPLVILGLDAGDHGLIERWAREGYLPTIASIMQRGCWGKTAGPELISEHGVWVSLFSGLSRGQHGYYYFRQLRPGTYDLENVTGDDVEAPPFWSSLAGSGKRVAIVDAREIPPRRGLDGVQLANWAEHSWAPKDAAFQVRSEPADLVREVRRAVGPQIPVYENLHASVRQDRQFHRRLLQRIERKGAVCRYLTGRDRFDLVVAVFTESHWAGHQFWRYRPEALPADPPPAADALAHAIRDVYQAIDRQLGLLLATLSPRANVFVVSSVGMEDHYPTGGLVEALCRQLGYQATPEATSRPRTPLALARRALPEAVRIALSRHLPRDSRERLLADQFRDGTDWTKTTAFAIPSAYTSFPRVNLEGREPRG